MRHLAICFLLLLTAAAISAAQSNITLLNPPHSQYAEAYSVNNAGQMVGYYAPLGDHWHGFLYDINQGTYVTLQPPGPPKAVTTQVATGINDAGEIVGFLYLSPSIRTSHGFLRNAQGVYSKITYPDNPLSQAANDINNFGDIVGFYVPPGQRNSNGYLLHQGVFTTLIYPGQTETVAVGINDAGTIVGTYDVLGSGRHGFMLQSNAFTEITIPGATQVDPFSINNLGDIAGEYFDSANVAHGFLLKRGVVETIDCPGAAGTAVLGVNDSDVIVGDCFFTVLPTAFVGTP